jgi:hypothetical protein
VRKRERNSGEIFHVLFKGKRRKLAGKQWMNACSTYVVESANIK